MEDMLARAYTKDDGLRGDALLDYSPQARI